jgi:outer membrane lipoprotein-sorting protein
MRVKYFRETMRKPSKLLFAFFIAIFLLPSRTIFAAENLDSVLRKLDVAAAHFKSTSADFQFDSVQTDPIEEKDTQKGSIYYERNGSVFQMAAHLRDFNGKPTPKVYSYSKGVFKLWEGGNLNKVTTFAKASKFESYLMLGFGASGKELADKWDITYVGSETLDGVKTEKLELVAKDPEVKKNLPKVTLWMDTDRAISLKQLFDEGPGQYRVSVFFNIKVNEDLPGDAFSFKTDGKTQFITR